MKKVLVTAILAGLLFSSGASAVLDRVWYNAGWTTQNINSNNYQALAQEGTLAGPVLKVYGVSANGSGTYDIASTNYANTWNAPVLARSENYVELSSRTTVQNQWYGLKANGVIDSLYYSSGYQIYANSSGTGIAYKAITCDFASNQFLYGARADGTGVDRLTFYGASLGIYDHISNIDFKELETVSGIGNQIYGVTANGTVNMVFYSNGWQSETVATGYKAVAANYDGGDYWLFAARANGAGVDRLHRDSLGNWAVTDSLLTTANYDDLATVHGYINQFYGSTVPEPATLAILGLGGLLLSRRRK